MSNCFNRTFVTHCPGSYYLVQNSDHKLSALQSRSTVLSQFFISLYRSIINGTTPKVLFCQTHSEFKFSHLFFQKITSIKSLWSLLREKYEKRCVPRCINSHQIRFVLKMNHFSLYAYWNVLVWATPGLLPYYIHVLVAFFGSTLSEY